MRDTKVRLHVDHPLGPEQSVSLTEAQAHYLFSVMRLGPGAAVTLFNGRDGAWRADVLDAGRKRGVLIARVRTAAQTRSPGLMLIFAPLKKARTDMIVEKAVELGATALQPVLTDFTNADRLRTDRMQAQAIEAAEQCGALQVPHVHEAQPLARVLAGWAPARPLIWADEMVAGPATTLAGLAACLPVVQAGPAAGSGLSLSAGDGNSTSPAILIGPEGGFSQAERDRLLVMPSVVRIALGPRILRAETAAMAALVLWQAACGDWR